MSQCTYRCVVLPDPTWDTPVRRRARGLNAPTGAWCSLTGYRTGRSDGDTDVSMHLQVRGAP